MRRLALVFALVLLAGGCVWPRHGLDAEGKREAAFADSVLGTHAPYALQSYARYLDGGTTGIRVVDSRGKEIRFAIDGRMGTPIPGSVTKAYMRGVAFRVPPRFIFLGADYPTHAGARPIAIQGREEKALMAMLDVISLEEFGRARRDSLVSILMSRDPTRTGPVYALPKRELDAVTVGAIARARYEMDPVGDLVDPAKDPNFPSLHRRFERLRRSGKLKH